MRIKPLAIIVQRFNLFLLMLTFIQIPTEHATQITAVLDDDSQQTNSDMWEHIYALMEHLHQRTRVRQSTRFRLASSSFRQKAPKNPSAQDCTVRDGCGKGKEVLFRTIPQKRDKICATFGSHRTRFVPPLCFFAVVWNHFPCAGDHSSSSVYGEVLLHQQPQHEMESCFSPQIATSGEMGKQVLLLPTGNYRVFFYGSCLVENFSVFFLSNR